MQLSRQTLDYMRSLIANDAIVRAPAGSKELLSKQGFSFYTWQFTLRNVLYTPRFLNAVAEHFWRINPSITKMSAIQLCGVESSSIPIIAAIQLLGWERYGYCVPAFTIRKEPKDYGRRNIIEGTYNPKLACLFVDDLISPDHATFWHCVTVLNNYNMTLYRELFVVLAKMKADDQAMVDGIPTSHGSIAVKSIFTLDDFDLS